MFQSSLKTLPSIHFIAWKEKKKSYFLVRFFYCLSCLSLDLTTQKPEVLDILQLEIVKFDTNPTRIAIRCYTLYLRILTWLLRHLWGSPCVRLRASAIAVTKQEAVKPLVSLSCVPFKRSTYQKKALELTLDMIGCNT